jgi:hypothetical protein
MHLNLNIFFLLLLSLILMAFLSCEAPRQNPFDPEAENYQEPVIPETIVVRIHVVRLYPPNEGIENVRVSLENLDLFKRTDATGLVSWQLEPVDSLEITVNATGYFQDTLSFATNSEDIDTTIKINARPVIDQDKFTSIYTNSGDSDDITRLFIQARITDPDGPTDIKSVTFNLEQDSFSVNLDPVEDRKYEKNFKLTSLPGDITIAELPELTFSLRVENLIGGSISSSPYSIKRVIDEQLRQVSPNNNQPASGNILFIWEKVNLLYTHFYYVELFSWPTVQRIGRFGPVSSDQDRFLLDDPEILNELDPGSYIWILQVEDLIGNQCKSTSLVFQYTN